VLAVREGAPIVAEPAPPVRPRAARAGARLLVAEDNPVNQKVATALLERLGYRVDVVANGREAVDGLEHVPYAAVLMDCQMPVMNGYEASAEIRRREAGSPGRHVPIVALTASAVKGDEERCLDAGMDAYVTKPVTLEMLGAVLDQLLEPGRPRPDADILDPATVRSLWELGGGGPDLLAEVTETFLAAAVSDIATLRQSVAGADLAAVAGAAHRLRGSCSAVGASAMARLAGVIEAAAWAGLPEGLGDDVARLDRALDDVRVALQDAVATAVPAEAATARG
jgi:CheY-like chemotaxis protein